jgi:tetratricopeptide (TPR) repeat protein
MSSFGRPTRRAVLLVGSLFALGLALAFWFPRSPEFPVHRHLERADQYLSGHRHREAVLEYRNVLGIDKTNARAIRQLGLLHYRLGEFGSAFRYLQKTRELEPNNLDVRLKLGAIYLLLLARKPEEARTAAAFVLEKEPKIFDAIVLLGSAVTTPVEIDAAIMRLETLRGEIGRQAKFHLALAAMHVRRGAVGAAERSLDEAVAAEPNSVEARRALGDFLVGRGNFERSEKEYKAAAALAPNGSRAQIALADLHFLLGRRDKARQVLEEITAKAPHFLPAWRRRAEFALAEQRYDECLEALDRLFKRSPSDLDGLLLRGRLRLARRDTTKAIEDFRRIEKLEPRLASVHYYLALAHLQAGNPGQARSALRDATLIDPEYAEAALLM